MIELLFGDNSIILFFALLLGVNIEFNKVVISPASMKIVFDFLVFEVGEILKQLNVSCIVFYEHIIHFIPHSAEVHFVLFH